MHLAMRRAYSKSTRNRPRSSYARCRIATWRICAACLLGLLGLLSPAIAAAQDDNSGRTETISVDLRLRSGGRVDGLVVDHNEHALVITHGRTPYVFSWSELEGGSAYATRRKLLIFDRGDESLLDAEDRFVLGSLALAHERSDLAAKEFRLAKQADPDYANRVKAAFDEYRRRRKASREDPRALAEDANGVGSDSVEEGSLARRVEAELGRLSEAGTAPHLDDESRERVMEVYRSFGEKVKEIIGADVVLLESEHFLIWTDLSRKERDRLAVWCESMYAALCEQFGLDPAERVFLAKCPVFCWRSKGRFRKFARLFDGYSGEGSVGYTRSIESTGHVHVVLLRQGRSAIDLDHFACTLVHEATHAFLHRLVAPRLIPHWINEGYAELMAERVLKQRCPAGEKAVLLEKQYARYDWPIGDLLQSTDPIAVQEYAIAHSVVAYLESTDPGHFAEFIVDIKKGADVERALAARYDGLSLTKLERDWRTAVLANDSPDQQPEQSGVILPWSRDHDSP